MGAKWKYSFWRRRHERGPDIITIHGEGRAGLIAFRRGDALYLLGYEMNGKSWCNVRSDEVCQLTPMARRLPVEEGLAIIEELRGALPSIEVQ